MSDPKQPHPDESHPHEPVPPAPSEPQQDGYGLLPVGVKMIDAMNRALFPLFYPEQPK